MFWFSVRTETEVMLEGVSPVVPQAEGAAASLAWPLSGHGA